MKDVYGLMCGVLQAVRNRPTNLGNVNSELRDLVWEEWMCENLSYSHH